MFVQIQLHDGAGVHTLAEVATSDSGGSSTPAPGTTQQPHQDVHTEQQHFLITGEDGNGNFIIFYYECNFVIDYSML